MFGENETIISDYVYITEHQTVNVITMTEH